MAKTKPTHERPRIVFPGGGIFFWWQAGAVKALQEFYDLDAYDFAGASAGSLSAVFCACKMDMDHVFQVAQRLAAENEVWTRRQGLAGIWGAMIDSWLHEVLPENAAQLCDQRVSISVTTLRPWLVPLERREVRDFKTKEDVIAACMTSIHIPFFIDGNAVRDFQGQMCVDGSLLFFLQGKPWSLEEEETPPHLLCYHEEDKALMERQHGFLETISVEAFEEMFLLGYQHVKGLRESNRLELVSSSRSSTAAYTAASTTTTSSTSSSSSSSSSPLMQPPLVTAHP